MKKIIAGLLLCISFLSLQNVKASDIEIDNIDIQATLQEDGSALFQETWDMYVDEGTEVYKVFDNMKESQVELLSVENDLKQRYTYKDWDVDLPKEQKDGHYGLIKEDDHYEICFGIGDYGKRTYTFKYKITNFVKQYSHDQGFNYAFLSDMSTTPKHVKVTLKSAHDFNKQNSQIYGFGYHGQVNFQSGKVVLETTSALPDKGKVQLLMRIDNGTFAKASIQQTDFQDILDEAIKGSDYDQQKSNQGYASAYKEDYTWLYVIGGIGAGVFLLCMLYCGYKYKVSKSKYMFVDHSDMPTYKDVDMFRDIPCSKDIFEFYYLSKKLGILDDERSGLMSAILLRWIQKGDIQFEKTETKSLGIFKKEGFRIDLNKDIVCTNELEEKILDYFKQASGSNGVLETKEFEKWCTRNYSKIDDFFDEVDSYMDDKYRQSQLLKTDVINVRYLGKDFPNDIEVYDLRVKEEMKHILGLKKFLEEMSYIHEKEVIEVKMWEEYLIFASILGIADQVEKQLGRLCPTFNEESSLDTLYTMHMVHMFSYNSMMASMNASRSSGFGGSSSFGGGGSFSGGGGGGVR